MKYAPALLPFYLSCAAPKAVETPAPIIVEISRSNSPSLEKAELMPLEPSFKQVTYFVTDSFKRIAAARRQQSLEGIMYFQDTSESCTYNYDTSAFCNPDTKARYSGKISLDYTSFQEANVKYTITKVILTDVPPFGSVDKVELFMDGDIKTPHYAVFGVTPHAQQFYETLLRQFYAELQQYKQNTSSWEDFDMERAVAKKNGSIYRTFTSLLEELASKETMNYEEVPFFNPCETD